jgi:hypothetical protein
MTSGAPSQFWMSAEGMMAAIGSRWCHSGCAAWPLDQLASSKPARIPASVVLTNWPSITPADGLAERPEASRVSITNLWFIDRHVPSARERF